MRACVITEHWVLAKTPKRFFPLYSKWLNRKIKLRFKKRTTRFNRNFCHLELYKYKAMEIETCFFNRKVLSVFLKFFTYMLHSRPFKIELIFLCYNSMSWEIRFTTSSNEICRKLALYSLTVVYAFHCRSWHLPVSTPIWLQALRSQQIN